MIALVNISYLIAMLSFILGLKFLSSPSKAKHGNILAGTGMVLAVIVTLISQFFGFSVSINLLLILLAIVTGTIVGKRMSDRVEMTAMPQLVSLFNAMGGGCAMLLGIMEARLGTPPSSASLILLWSGLIIGAASFSGSVIAYRKLAGKQKDKRTRMIMYVSRILLVSFLVIPGLYLTNLLPLGLVSVTLILSSLALVYGILFVLPIGGADMPVVISLLNSLTGIATALAGILYNNTIMIAGGIFVGAAGILLTLLMCNAMNRSIFAVIGGKFNGSGVSSGDEEEIEIKATSIGETATKLAFAQKVAIVPGYGLAVAQAQHLCSQLQAILEEKDTEVHYIIHPVAGRMPGHMNVLLAEADVHYDKLKEMDLVNDEMNEYDVTIVIGANDVVNPAAEQDENSPIYGMPIIKAYNSREVVVIKRGMSKGYAGVENRLFGYDNCQLLFSDAKVALSGLINELKVL
ncbi:NAD(P)(+) transhydrogenase (Re/Si-specific) subunit beta [Wandonia haliotis]|uniref:NAD(P) transhydrogenase subunit beta n=1 Tax=Wandonia haliotis TaxID=574963 RepID=A0ABN1MR00_9FLAO